MFSENVQRCVVRVHVAGQAGREIAQCESLEDSRAWRWEDWGNGLLIMTQLVI